MDSSASISRTGETTDRLHTLNPPSKLKTYGFAIVIIVGIGGLVVGGVGVAGYLGAISHLSEVQAMIMMAAGGGGGAILFIVGVIGTVKNRQNTGLQHNRSGDQAHRSDEVIQHSEVTQPSDQVSQPVQVSRQEIIRTTDTQGGLVYGADAWRIWGAEVLDRVPQAPSIDWNANDPYFNEPYRNSYVLLYIPQKIRAGGEEKDLTLQALREISGGPFEYFSKFVAEQFGGSTSPGWVLVSKKVIPESRSKSYQIQKDMVEANVGFRMPQTLEAIALNLMVFAFTDERLYEESPLTYTRCVEMVNGVYPVVVGGFGSDGLDVHHAPPSLLFSFDSHCYGVAALRKF